jgi:cell division initiation protein
MRISPLDIQNQRFRSRWRGLDGREVETFLTAVAEDYTALLHELSRHEDQVRRLEARVEELSLNESLLKETLVTAQNLGDEMRTTAQQQASVQISEAEVKAEKILDAAHRRAGRIGEEIQELRGLRSRLSASMRSSLETHLALVDALETDPPAAGHDASPQSGAPADETASSSADLSASS